MYINLNVKYKNNNKGIIIITYSKNTEECINFKTNDKTTYIPKAYGTNGQIRSHCELEGIKNMDKIQK